MSVVSDANTTVNFNLTTATPYSGAYDNTVVDPVVNTVVRLWCISTGSAILTLYYSNTGDDQTDVTPITETYGIYANNASAITSLIKKKYVKVTLTVDSLNTDQTVTLRTKFAERTPHPFLSYTTDDITTNAVISLEDLTIQGAYTDTITGTKTSTPIRTDPNGNMYVITDPANPLKIDANLTLTSATLNLDYTTSSVRVYGSNSTTGAATAIKTTPEGSLIVEGKNTGTPVKIGGSPADPLTGIPFGNSLSTDDYGNLNVTGPCPVVDRYPVLIGGYIGGDNVLVHSPKSYIVPLNVDSTGRLKVITDSCASPLAIEGLKNGETRYPISIGGTYYGSQGINIKECIPLSVDNTGKLNVNIVSGMPSITISGASVNVDISLNSARDSVKSLIYLNDVSVSMNNPLPTILMNNTPNMYSSSYYYAFNSLNNTTITSGLVSSGSTYINVSGMSKICINILRINDTSPIKLHPVFLTAKTVNFPLSSVPTGSLYNIAANYISFPTTTTYDMNTTTQELLLTYNGILADWANVIVTDGSMRGFITIYAQR